MSNRSIFLRPKKIIDAGDMSQASITSTALKLEDLYSAILQFIWSSADAVGQFDVQGSLDAAPDGAGVPQGGTWNSMPGVAARLVHPAAAAGSYLLDLGEIAVPYVRVVYTRASGGAASTLTVWFAAKGS